MAPKPHTVARRLICGVPALFLATGLLGAAGDARTVATRTRATVASLDIATRYYTMTVRFRPLLFWMTRDDVGGARISWDVSSPVDRSLELLIGSDPDTAPMSVNRWGFISERTLGNTSRLTGVMTETDDKTIDAARENPAEAANGGHVFRTIRATVRDNEAATSTSRLVLDTDVTYRRYAALLDRMPATDRGAARLKLEAGTDPGFLTAMKALVHDSVEAWRTDGRPTAGAGLHRDYVYMGKIYGLSLLSAPVVRGAAVAGRTYDTAVDGEFQIRNKATGQTTTFEMLYGVAGAEKETPLRVIYRPRWWVELQLLLVDPSASKIAMALPAPAWIPR